MAKRMSIKDVAQHAGVSYQTVSRVINNKPDVSSETRSRVQAAIDSLNYRPSLAAQVFAHERTMIIGVVIPWSADFLSDNHHLLQLLTGADREANLRDYMVLLSAARSKNDAQSSYERRFWSGQPRAAPYSRGGSLRGPLPSRVVEGDGCRIKNRHSRE